MLNSSITKPATTACLVAMGGNSLLDPKQNPTVSSQFEVTARAVGPIAELIASGQRVVLTHGNGPQVGFMLMRSELSREALHEVPLDSLVANSQGSIGYMIQHELREQLRRRGLDHPVASVVTEVEVDPTDSAFAKPTKPVGKFYSAAQAEVLQREQGWNMVEDSNRGYRRVVASPLPLRIVELAAIRTLVDGGATVIACGGGGIPIARQSDGSMHGIEAVIDKDRASALLAVQLGVERLFITTGVDAIYVDYLTPQRRALPEIRASELRALTDAGQFPAGSMGPKVDAALYFLDHGGKECTICTPESLVDAFAGNAGTRVVRG